MAKEPEDNNEDERHPYEGIADRAEELGLEGEEKDDYIERRMQRAGFKRGTGEWVAVSDDDDDDDDEKDDDDTPVTRGEIRRMNKDRKRAGGSYSPPKRRPKTGGEGGKPSSKKDPWW